MRIIGRFVKILLYMVGLMILVLTVPQLYHKYSDYVQRERIFTKVQQATNQVSNKEAPENWQTLNNWWLVNQDGTLIYNATNLSAKDQSLAVQAADWWNKMAGRTLITSQTDTGINADVYLAYVNNNYLNFSGLTGTNHVLLINQASLSTNSTSSNQDNDTVNIMIHELGHALGLAHAPQDYNDIMSPKQIADGVIKSASNYDRAALDASFTRMASALHQNMSEVSYMQVSAQTPYPDLSRLSDQTYNARDGLASVLNSTLAKVKHKTDITDQQEQVLANAKEGLKSLQSETELTDKQIMAAQSDLEALIEAFELQSDFPQAYRNSQNLTGSEKVDSFIQEIQDTF